MSATGEDVLLRPRGTFSNVPAHRRRIKQKIFADIFDGDLFGATGGGQRSDPVLIRRRSTGSFSDATPYRGRVRGKIIAGIFKRSSSGCTVGGQTSDPMVVRCLDDSFSDASLYCSEILASLFKRESFGSLGTEK